MIDESGPCGIDPGQAARPRAFSAATLRDRAQACGPCWRPARPTATGDRSRYRGHCATRFFAQGAVVALPTGQNPGAIAEGLDRSKPFISG
jgi:hypothetical protein